MSQWHVYDIVTSSQESILVVGLVAIVLPANSSVFFDVVCFYSYGWPKKKKIVMIYSLSYPNPYDFMSFFLETQKEKLSRMFTQLFSIR